MSSVKSLRVTSHVGRDLLASATHFKTEAAAIWEYVVNSLQYIEDHVPPRIQVTIKPRAKSIEISDNGRGMAEEDLKSFFTMHGENIDRMKGRPGRGKFGTGKSAASRPTSSTWVASCPAAVSFLAKAGGNCASTKKRSTSGGF